MFKEIYKVIYFIIILIFVYLLFAIYFSEENIKKIKKKYSEVLGKILWTKEKLNQINPSLGLLAKPNFCSPILPAK